MSALIENEVWFTYFLLQDLQKIPNVSVIVQRMLWNSVVCLLCCYIAVCIFVKPIERFPLLWTIKVFFVCVCRRVCVCPSVWVRALPVKDKCMRQWKQIWLRIKIDAERHGWLLALNTEALTFFHLCYILSVSLTLFIPLNVMAACSYWPLAAAEGHHNWT